jgi:hypothetical protein
MSVTYRICSICGTKITDPDILKSLNARDARNERSMRGLQYLEEAFELLLLEPYSDQIHEKVLQLQEKARIELNFIDG